MAKRRNALSLQQSTTQLDHLIHSIATSTSTTTYFPQPTHKLGSGGEGAVYAEASGAYAIKQTQLSADDNVKDALNKALAEQFILSTTKINTLHDIRVSKHHLYKAYTRHDITLKSYASAFDTYMPEPILRHIMFDVCTAVKALHNANYVHRDIKPDNIMRCTATDTWTVIDYDMMKYHGKNGIQSSFAGTFGYTAPEICELDEKAWIGYGVDVWSIGVSILSCINKGDIGVFEMLDEEFDAIETGFLHWHNRVFGDGGWRRYVKRLYDANRISKSLFGLLYRGIFVRNPHHRMTMSEVLNHSWFAAVDSDVSELSSAPDSTDTQSDSETESDDDFSDSESDSYSGTDSTSEWDSSYSSVDSDYTDDTDSCLEYTDQSD
eukprot:884474_1